MMRSLIAISLGIVIGVTISNVVAICRIEKTISLLIHAGISSNIGNLNVLERVERLEKRVKW